MKKKSHGDTESSKKLWIQILRIMRLTILFILLGLFNLSAGVLSQISLDVENKTYKEVFREIEGQTSYRFFFSDDINALNEKVSLNKKDSSLEDVLDELTDKNDLHYAVLTNNVVVISPFETQQSRKLTGEVKDPLGDPLIGVSISVQGTSRGVITDIDGKYAIDVTDGDVLVFSYIGFNPQQVTINGNQVLNITMREDATVLDEIVVTALGIKKKEKSLTYSTQIVNGDELTRAKDPNMITALAGKTAGVQINKSASGLGGSAKVIIRGNRSAAGNNQPLYVIDGVPMNNNLTDQTVSSVGGTNDSANRDGGDGISNLNPDDIESMNILKGPAAAALYGSQAANGVVVITTKKGKAGMTSISFNSNTTWEQAAYGIPEFQNSYTGKNDSWGSAINGSPDYTKDFFNSGITTINSLSLSAGTERMQTYFSYANTYGKGVIEGNEMMKHNFNFRETANFFDNKLTLDANINLMYQKLNNRSVPGGYYLNPLVGLYSFPRGGVEGGQSFDYYKENYMLFNQERNMYLQNWYTDTDMNQNPYWLTNKMPSEDVRTRALANLALTYKINDKFSLQLRGNGDFISDKFNQKMYAGTHPSLAGNNGRYITYEATNMNTYGDILLTYQSALGEDFALNASVGSSITDQRIKTLRLDSRGSGVGLFYPNVFTIGNMDLSGGYIVEENIHRQDQSIFFAGQLGFRDWLFLDVTARNDWSSTLAFTDSDKKGFFYPSIGLTWIINESVSMPEWVTLGKLRGAWSQVGNALPLYISNPVNTIGAGGNFQAYTAAPFSELKPEKTASLEFGTEWKFFSGRVDFDFTYYKTNTTNQLFTLPAPSGSGYSVYYVNAGDIKNEGMEIVLGGSPILTETVRWKTSFNFSTNKNKVLELADGLDYFVFGQAANTNYQMRLEKDGSFGDIYGRAFKRDENGKIQYDDAGLPINDSEADLTKIGNAAPKWNLGWANTVSYKDFSLYFLIDGRFGGDALSITQAGLDALGVSKATGDARLNKGVNFDGKTIDAKGFYTTVGGRGGITEYYIYDATNIRLREVALSYKLPKSLFEDKAIKGCEISLVGRNLFFFKKDAPYDPDASLSTGNNLQGVDVFGMPTNRSFGLNLKLNF